MRMKAGRSSVHSRSSLTGNLHSESFMNWSPSCPVDIETDGLIVKFKTVSNMLLASRKFAKRNKTYTTQPKENLYTSCRYFLAFGKLIGLVPLGAKLKDEDEIVNGGLISRIVGTAIVTMLSASAAVGLLALGKSTFLNAAEYSRAPIMFAFYFCGTFMYSYMHRNSSKLFQLFKSWNQVHVFFTEIDTKLHRDVNLVAGLIMTSAIFENLVSQARLAPMFSTAGASNKTFLQIYYTNNSRQWEKLVPYNTFMGVYTFAMDKLAWYSWNYVDILTFVFARALAFKFKALYTQCEAISEHRQYFHDQARWKQMTKDHHNLCTFVIQVTEFVSPLLFISLATNVYCVCLQMHFGLQVADSRTGLDTSYAIWSLSHLLARIYIVISSGSRMNIWAHKFVELLRRCPADAYSLDVLRAERFINRNIIALTGLGCFRVTKSLFLDIIGVIFTFEIVILQAQEQSRPDPTPSPTFPDCMSQSVAS